MPIFMVNSGLDVCICLACSSDSNRAHNLRRISKEQKALELAQSYPTARAFQSRRNADSEPL